MNMSVDNVVYTLRDFKKLLIALRLLKALMMLMTVAK